MYFLRTLLTLLFPPYCLYCHSFSKQTVHLCKKCLEAIRPVVSGALKISTKKEVKVFSIGAYADPLRALIRSKHRKSRVAAHTLGQLLWSEIKNVHLDFDVLVPIPLHWSRYAWRWYNQAEVIGSVISSKSNKPLSHTLKRSVRTSFQSGLSRIARERNVENVFQVVDTLAVKDKHVVLVDDVMTSGATIKSAIKVLQKHRPKKITVVVAARVV
jgi:ComF family protein